MHMKNCFGRWDVLHLLHVESIDFFVYVNVNVSYLGKDVEAHISHIICTEAKKTS